MNVSSNEQNIFKTTVCKKTVADCGKNEVKERGFSKINFCTVMVLTY